MRRFVLWLLLLGLFLPFGGDGQIVIRKVSASGGGTNPGTGDLLHWWNLNNVDAADPGDGLYDQVAGSWNLTNNSASNSAGTGPGGKDCIDMADTAYVDRTDVAWDGGASNITVSIWANADAVSSTGNWLFSWRGASLAVPYLTQLNIVNGSPNTGQWAPGDGTNPSDRAIATGTSTISTGTWYHFVGTWDGTTARIYVNGTEEATATNASFGAFTGTAMPFSIGSRSWSTKNDAATGHDGKLALCGIWDVALTADNITWLYNGGAGRNYSEL